MKKYTIVFPKNPPKEGATDAPKMNGYRKINNQPVILSGENRKRFS